MGLRTATLSIDQSNCSPGILNFQLSKINHLTWLGFRTGYWNVSYQQQSSGFQSPSWSFSINVCLFLSQHNSFFYFWPVLVLFGLCLTITIVVIQKWTVWTCSLLSADQLLSESITKFWTATPSSYWKRPSLWRGPSFGTWAEKNDCSIKEEKG